MLVPIDSQVTFGATAETDIMWSDNDRQFKRRTTVGNEL